MREDKFYEICDAAESINTNITEDYFPSPAEIESNINAYGIDSQIDLLAYYASNPFKRQGLPAAEDDDYLDTVKYCKNKLNNVPLEEVI